MVAVCNESGRFLGASPGAEGTEFGLQGQNTCEYVYSTFKAKFMFPRGQYEIWQGRHINSKALVGRSEGWGI